MVAPDANLLAMQSRVKICEKIYELDIKQSQQSPRDGLVIPDFDRKIELALQQNIYELDSAKSIDPPRLSMLSSEFNLREMHAGRTTCKIRKQDA